jgi:uncharacterized protein (DUF58 family)
MILSADSLRILSALSLRTKRSFYGTRHGSHRSLRRGHGMEFAEYRTYEVGDNPRAIDWNLYGRSDKLYSKRFLEEENVAVYIIIDGSRSITHPALREKWDCARYLALATSYIALASHDMVTISILGGATSCKYSGGRSYGHIQDFLHTETQRLDRNSNEVIDLKREAQLLASRLAFPGICIFISDFLYPHDLVYEMFSHLRARNLELHAVQVLGKDDVSPVYGGDSALYVDSETGEGRELDVGPRALEQYNELLQAHNESIRLIIGGQGASFVQVALDPTRSVEVSAVTAVTSMGIFV